MNKELWKSLSGFVFLEKYPGLPCPYCGESALAFEAQSITVRVLSDKFKLQAQYHSRHYNNVKEHQRNTDELTGNLLGKAWDTHPFLGVLGGFGAIALEVDKEKNKYGQFSGFMKCKACSDYVAVNGLSLHYLEKPDSTPQKLKLKVESFSLPLPLFPINEFVPYSVEKELLGAFSYYHFDPSSSANKLRRAMERFCDSLGAEGKTLHARLKNLPAEYQREARFLNTLRLVGNEGTHDDGVAEDDLLHAFDIFHKVLEIFPRLEELKQLEETDALLIKKFDKSPDVTN